MLASIQFDRIRDTKRHSKSKQRGEREKKKEQQAGMFCTWHLQREREREGEKRRRESESRLLNSEEGRLNDLFGLTYKSDHSSLKGVRDGKKRERKRERDGS